MVGQLVEWWDDSGSGWISVDGTPFFFFFRRRTSCRCCIRSECLKTSRSPESASKASLLTGIGQDLYLLSGFWTVADDRRPIRRGCEAEASHGCKGESDWQMTVILYPSMPSVTHRGSCDVLRLPSAPFGEDPEITHTTHTNHPPRNQLHQPEIIYTVIPVDPFQNSFDHATLRPTPCSAPRASYRTAAAKCSPVSAYFHVKVGNGSLSGESESEATWTSSRRGKVGVKKRRNGFSLKDSNIFSTANPGKDSRFFIFSKRFQHLRRLPSVSSTPC